MAPKVYTPELTFIFSYDGGKSVTTNYFREIWNQIVSYEPGGPEKFISKHYFFNGRVGFLIGSEGNIIQTTNTGQSWRNISSGVVEDLWDLMFLNRQTGFVVGDFGRILKTTNGGETWRKTNSGTQENVYAIGFKNDTEGWAGTESGLLATVDGGESWQPVPLRYCHGPIREIEFDQAGNGYAYTYKLYPNETGHRPGGYMLLLLLRNGSVSVANSATDLPRTLHLSQNYPNPFNQATHLEFYLPVAAPVTLQIFNLQGQLIRTLLDETRTAGEHRITWDGATTDGHLAVTGMYFYRINCQGETLTRKLLVVK